MRNLFYFMLLNIKGVFFIFLIMKMSTRKRVYEKNMRSTTLAQ